MPSMLLTPIEITLLSALVLVLAWTSYLHFRLYRITKGSTGNLETALASAQTKYEQFVQSEKALQQKLANIDTRLTGSVRGVHTVRFNPFAEQGGGKHSFATALITEQGEGVIISTLNARDRVSVFAKTISDGKSEHELTDEERQALEKAQENMHTSAM